MTRLPGWRDRAATDLVLKHLDHLRAEGPVLVMEDPHGDDLAAALEELGESVTVWNRRVRGEGPASPWPPAAPVPGFRSAFLRLPKSRDELDMAAHAAAHRLAPGGRLFVYGARDEGAASAAGRLEPLFPEAWTLATGGRCRLIEAPFPGANPDAPHGAATGPAPDLRAPLEAWRIESDPPHPDVAADRWVSYPGVFAAGRLDDGTALLLEHLPDLASSTGPPRVLDFGCGDGIVSAVLAGRTPGLAPEMLDVDTVALEAAAENVPGGLVLPAEGMRSLGVTPPFDAIVSNPPYHRGKAETVDVVRELVVGAAERLAPHGSLTLVLQRRLPVDTALHRAFRSVEVVADRGAFRVWRGTRPATER